MILESLASRDGSMSIEGIVSTSGKRVGIIISGGNIDHTQISELEQN